MFGMTLDYTTSYRALLYAQEMVRGSAEDGLLKFIISLICLLLIKRLPKFIISLICKCVNTLLAHVLHLGKHCYWFYKKFTTKRVDMQFTKQTTNKTIIDHSSTKTSLDSTLYGRRLCQKTSRKSRRLPGSPDDFQEVQTTSRKSRRLPGSADDFQTTSRKSRRLDDCQEV